MDNLQQAFNLQYFQRIVSQSSQLIQTLDEPKNNLIIYYENIRNKKINQSLFSKIKSINNVGPISDFQFQESSSISSSPKLSDEELDDEEYFSSKFNANKQNKNNTQYDYFDIKSGNKYKLASVSYPKIRAVLDQYIPSLFLKVEDSLDKNNEHHPPVMLVRNISKNCTMKRLNYFLEQFSFQLANYKIKIGYFQSDLSILIRFRNVSEAQILNTQLKKGILNELFGNNYKIQWVIYNLQQQQAESEPKQKQSNFSNKPYSESKEEEQPYPSQIFQNKINNNNQQQQQVSHQVLNEFNYQLPYSIILRNIPSFYHSSVKLKDFFKKNKLDANQFVYIEEPFKVNDIDCAVCYLDNLENAEVICSKLNNKIVDDDQLLKVNMNPESQKFRQQKYNSHFKNYILGDNKKLFEILKTKLDELKQQQLEKQQLLEQQQREEESRLNEADHLQNDSRNNNGTINLKATFQAALSQSMGDSKQKVQLPFIKLDQTHPNNQTHSNNQTHPNNNQMETTQDISEEKDHFSSQQQQLPYNYKTHNSRQPQTSRLQNNSQIQFRNSRQQQPPQQQIPNQIPILSQSQQLQSQPSALASIPIQSQNQLLSQPSIQPPIIQKQNFPPNSQSMPSLKNVQQTNQSPSSVQAQQLPYQQVGINQYQVPYKQNLQVYQGQMQAGAVIPPINKKFHQLQQQPNSGQLHHSQNQILGSMIQNVSPHMRPQQMQGGQLNINSNFLSNLKNNIVQNDPETKIKQQLNQLDQNQKKDLENYLDELMYDEQKQKQSELNFLEEEYKRLQQKYNIQFNDSSLFSQTKPSESKTSSQQDSKSKHDSMLEELEGNLIGQAKSSVDNKQQETSNNEFQHETEKQKKRRLKLLQLVMEEDDSKTDPFKQAKKIKNE